tara:strand:- start:61 stop:531 length:471 start_codon:yes stop_codon:yes gene_type:complete
MKQKRKGATKSKYKLFFKDFNFEIKVILLLALGIFLLVEELEIKHFLFKLIKLIIFNIGKVIQWLLDKSAVFIMRFEFSDIVGISILLYVLYLIINRLRERLFNRFPNINKCSKCNGKIHRIRKKWQHKVLSYVYFITVKHYRCTECNYQEIKLVK